MCRIHAVADATLGHEHWVRRLRFEALDHGDVLLADAAWGRAFPEPGVALEALGREFAVEELHRELREHRPLSGVTSTAGQQGLENPGRSSQCPHR